MKQRESDLGTAYIDGGPLCVPGNEGRKNAFPTEQKNYSAALKDAFGAGGSVVEVRNPKLQRLIKVFDSGGTSDVAMQKLQAAIFDAKLRGDILEDDPEADKMLEWTSAPTTPLGGSPGFPGMPTTPGKRGKDQFEYFKASNLPSHLRCIYDVLHKLPLPALARYGINPDEDLVEKLGSLIETGGNISVDQISTLYALYIRRELPDLRTLNGNIESLVEALKSINVDSKEIDQIVGKIRFSLFSQVNNAAVMSSNHSAKAYSDFVARKTEAFTESTPDSSRLQNSDIEAFFNKRDSAGAKIFDALMDPKIMKKIVSEVKSSGTSLDKWFEINVVDKLQAGATVVLSGNNAHDIRPRNRLVGMDIEEAYQALAFFRGFGGTTVINTFLLAEDAATGKVKIDWSKPPDTRLDGEMMCFSRNLDFFTVVKHFMPNLENENVSPRSAKESYMLAYKWLKQYNYNGILWMPLVEIFLRGVDKGEVRSMAASPIINTVDNKGDKLLFDGQPLTVILTGLKTHIKPNIANPKPEDGLDVIRVQKSYEGFLKYFGEIGNLLKGHPETFQKDYAATMMSIVKALRGHAIENTKPSITIAQQETLLAEILPMLTRLYIFISGKRPIDELCGDYPFVTQELVTEGLYRPKVGEAGYRASGVLLSKLGNDLRRELALLANNGGLVSGDANKIYVHRPGAGGGLGDIAKATGSLLK